MQIIAALPTDPPHTVDMAAHSVHESIVEPTAALVASPAPEQVLVDDSDTGLQDEINRDENEWVVSPPHPSEFIEPPPLRPVYYVVTIGEEAGIYDGTWAETFNIRRVSRLEEFSLRVFHSWAEAHAYYSQQYELNCVANAANNSDRAPSIPLARSAPANPPVHMTRAQSAPPLMSSAVTQTNVHVQTAVQPAHSYGSLMDCGSPNRPIYVQSNWPTPAMPKPAQPFALLPPATISQSARPAASDPPATGSRPAVQSASRPSVLATIAEELPRPRFPLTQLHFDQCGRLIQSGAISVSSSPEDNNLPPPAQAPRRDPQPFPLIPDPDFFTYPTPEPRREASVTISGQAIPETPISDRSAVLRRFVDLFPHDTDTAISGDRAQHGTPSPESDSGDKETCARFLFKTGVTPFTSASTSANDRPPVASSSNTLKVSKKRRSPTTTISQPPKLRKMASTKNVKKARAMSDPVEDGSGHGPDWMYLPDPK